VHQQNLSKRPPTERRSRMRRWSPVLLIGVLTVSAPYFAAAQDIDRPAELRFGRLSGGVRMDITEVMRRHEEQILRLPNVTGIGIGEKDSQPVIKIFVSVMPSEVELSQVPRVLDGYPTDVEEIGIVMTQPSNPTSSHSQ